MNIHKYNTVKRASDEKNIIRTEVPIVNFISALTTESVGCSEGTRRGTTNTKKRHGHERENGVHRRKGGLFFLDLDRAPQGEIRAVNQQEDKNQRSPSGPSSRTNPR